VCGHASEWPQPGASEANSLISNSLLKYSSPFVFSTQEKALEKRNRLERGPGRPTNGKWQGIRQHLNEN